jgi:hypothetical protein
MKTAFYKTHNGYFCNRIAVIVIAGCNHSSKPQMEVMKKMKNMTDLQKECDRNLKQQKTRDLAVYQESDI